MYIGHIATLLNIKDNLFIDFSTYKIAYKRKKNKPPIYYLSKFLKYRNKGSYISLAAGGSVLKNECLANLDVDTGGKIKRIRLRGG